MMEVRRSDSLGPTVVHDTVEHVSVTRIRDSRLAVTCYASCGSRIWEGADFADVYYERSSKWCMRRTGGVYDDYASYHWQCMPDEFTDVLRVFFPNQEWKSQDANAA